MKNTELLDLIPQEYIKRFDIWVIEDLEDYIRIRSTVVGDYVAFPTNNIKEVSVKNDEVIIIATEYSITLYNKKYMDSFHITIFQHHKMSLKKHK